jgi:hypothetical protein
MKTNPLCILIIIAMFLITACQEDTEQFAETSIESSIGLLQHNVYFYLNEDVSADEKTRFEDGLFELLSIDEVYRYEIGIPGSTEDREVTDHSFGYSFFSWFLTMEDYDIYANHPIHLEFIDEFNHLWADVKVYDSEIIGESGF